MNKKIGIIGSIINALSVFLFAIFMLFDFTFGSFFVCILLAISYLMMAVALEIWCAYFLPIGILAALHFKKK